MYRKITVSRPSEMLTLYFYDKNIFLDQSHFIVFCMGVNPKVRVISHIIERVIFLERISQILLGFDYLLSKDNISEKFKEKLIYSSISSTKVSTS